MSAITIVAFVLGVLTTMYFMGGRNPCSFQKSLKLEFDQMFRDESGMLIVWRVLHERAEALRVAYNALDNFRRRQNDLGFVNLSSTSAVCNNIVFENALSGAVADAHRVFDRAAGLAYLGGHGNAVDSVKKKFAKR